MAKAWRMIGGLCVLGAVALGGTAYLQRETLSTYLTSRSLAQATTLEERTRLAGELLQTDTGRVKFYSLYSSTNTEILTSANAAWLAHFQNAPTTDSTRQACTQALLAERDSFTAEGRTAALELVAHFAEIAEARPACKQLIQAGLKADVDAKLVAMKQAQTPNLRMTAELAPMLRDPEARVRRSAMYALGPNLDDTSPVTEEELFAFLHDTDAEVREACVSSLRYRGLDLGQISLARQLSHPETTERLALLTDLATGNLVKDATPWLERLSRDPDPAVRLGVARVAWTTMPRAKPWLTALTTHDPDNTVRRWAAYYQQQGETLRQMQYER
ncbi:MAG: HEAT repeat domain-containing protein [Fimbriiglobus sp.]